MEDDLLRQAVDLFNLEQQRILGELREVFFDECKARENVSIALLANLSLQLLRETGNHLTLLLFLRCLH